MVDHGAKHRTSSPSILSWTLCRGNALAEEDRVLIDLGSSQPALSGSVIIQGQRGLDEVIIRGTPDVDTILVDRHAVTVNETTVQLASAESLRIDTGPGEDEVQIADRLAFCVTVDGDAGPRGPGRPAAPPTAPIPPSGQASRKQRHTA